MGKIDKLSSIASETPPHLILLNETWCNSQISDAYLGIPGYELQMRIDREDTGGGRGGGILIYGKTGLSLEPIDAKTSFSQYCTFKVFDLTVYLIYRSPSSKQDNIGNLAELIRTCDKKSVIIGDFNFPDMNWEAGTASARTRIVAEAVEERNMEQLVTFPTHVKGNILDLLLTTIPERIQGLEDAGRLGKSDHIMLDVKISVGPEEKRDPGEKPDWRKADWEGMKESLWSRSLEPQMRGMGAEQAWSVLKEKINAAVEKFVPKKRRRNQNRPGWLSQDILREVRRKKRLCKKAKTGEGV